MNNTRLIKWGLFSFLCLIWGSSFILMKLGLYDNNGIPLLSAYQVAAIRMLSAGIILLPFLPGAFKKLENASTGWFILLSGLLGSFIPAFLFCIAETKVDSALAGTINAMTPLFVLLVSTIVYKSDIPKSKWLGIILGFVGCLLLFISKNPDGSRSELYALFAVVATICYGFNVNMVKHRLLHISSLEIATLAFVFLIPPSAFVLWYTGYFNLPLNEHPYIAASAASAVLGVFGTAIASVLFYVLVKRAGVVFSSLVTYGIPFVAIGWGLVYGEEINMMQVVSLIVILSGVYLANSSFLFSASKLAGKKNPDV